MSKPEKIIRPDSPEAATYRTDICGWVSRDGMFYGDGPSNERTARYAGSTHSLCDDCGALCPKHYVRCDACQNKRKIARYAALPRQAWDGTGMLYSDALDEYFDGLDGIYDRLADDPDITLDDLRIQLCKPNHASMIDGDHWADDLPEDGEIPAELQAAIDELNEVIAGLPPLSWSPAEIALDTTGMEQRP